jgi:hypothetical protein
MPLHKWDRNFDGSSWVNLGQIGNDRTTEKDALQVFKDTISGLRQNQDKSGYRLRQLQKDGTDKTLLEIARITESGDKIPDEINSETDNKPPVDDLSTKQTEDWKYILVIIIFIIIIAFWILAKKKGWI